MGSACGAPGIGKPIKTKETPHKHWDDNNNTNIVKANLKDRFLKMFQYKQSKVKSNPSFTFPNFKVKMKETPTSKKPIYLKVQHFLFKIQEI